MNCRSLRSLAFALVVAGLLSMGAAAPAQARMSHPEERGQIEFVQLAERAISSLGSLLQGFGEWVAASTATICGDGGQGN